MKNNALLKNRPFLHNEAVMEEHEFHVWTYKTIYGRLVRATEFTIHLYISKLTWRPTE